MRRLVAVLTGWSVLQRVMAMVALMMALGLLVAGVVSFAVQYRNLEERLDGELRQEVQELEGLAQAGPARDGTPYQDAAQLFFDFIATSVAGEDEAFLGLVDGEAVVYSGGTRPFDVSDPAVLEAVRSLPVSQGRARTTLVRTEETDLRVLVADVQLPAEAREATFVVLSDQGRQRAEIHRRAATFAAVSFAVLLLGTAVSALVLGRLLRPLRELRETTALISTDDLSGRVDVESAGDTDVAELAQHFNEMLDRIEDGMHQQRQFLDDAAHELRTPLTILRGNTELMDPADPDDVGATRHRLLDEMDRMQRLVDDLLLLARTRRPDFVRAEPTDLTELAVECMDRVTGLGDRAWRLSADVDAVLDLDRQRLIQAVVQLAANAFKFSDPGTPVELATSWADAAQAAPAVQAGAEPADRYVTLSVTDHGRGIPDGQLEWVFERFGRGDNAVREEGSGLGLPIVRAIAEAHGGAVTVRSAEGIGSRFTIWLPAPVDGPPAPATT